MKHLSLVLLASVFLPAAVCAGEAPAAGDKPLQEFALADFIKRDWTRETVFYDAAPGLHGRKDVALIGPDGKPRPFQWVEQGGKKRIAFQADVPALGKSAYRLAAGTPVAETDLKVEETAAEIRIVNAHTGIALRKKPGKDEGPIAGIRLLSGAWVGKSSFLKTPALVGGKARLLAPGPVFAEAECEIAFGGSKMYRLRIRVESGEPVVKIDESFNLGDESCLRIKFNEKFAPTQILHRNGYMTTKNPPYGGLLSSALAEDAKYPNFNWQPWPEWYVTERQGVWFGLYGEESADLLSLGARDPSSWVDPKAGDAPQSKPLLPLRCEGGNVYMDFPLTGGERRWLIGAFDKAPSLKLLEAKDEALKVAPPPQQSMIKHGLFPLDRVKNWVLEWEGTEEHPRIMVTRKIAERFKADYKPDLSRKGHIATLPSDMIAEALAYHLGTGDAEVGRHIAKISLDGMQQSIDNFVKQDQISTLGSTPHLIYGLMRDPINADVIFDTVLTPEEKARMRAMTAFIAYTVASPDFWSAERGFAANPNMTAMVASYLAVNASLIPSHPLAKEWLAAGQGELARQVMEWSDEKGGWIEAPHYAMVNFDYLLGMAFRMLNLGQGKTVFSPRLKAIGEYFAKISTPPDSGIGGFRRLPATGNTYPSEPTGEFGMIAALWKDEDPQYASEMQWMHKQQGQWKDAGIGGAFPALESFRATLFDPTIPEKKPDFQSTWFPETAVSLRNGVDDRETQLLLLAGGNLQHYDFGDRGSFTLWGKGRSVVEEFGYPFKSEEKAVAEFHSTVESRARAHEARVRTFTPNPIFDYIRVVSGRWHRQIAFVKDADMMAPNYFVIRDSLQTEADGRWRLWLNGKVVLPAQGGEARVVVEGKDDVDTDIVFLSPASPALETREASNEAVGVDPKRTYGPYVRTLNSLEAKMDRASDVFAVIYPRLKTEKPPKVTLLQKGQAVKIEHDAGTDYVFLAAKPFSATVEGIAFEGTSGLVKIRGGKPALALGEGGKIAKDKEKLSGGEIPAYVQQLAKSAGRQLYFDFECEEDLDSFRGPTINARRHKGNPASGDAKHKGKYCFAVTLSREERCMLNENTIQKIFIDPKKMYRCSMSVFAAQRIILTFGGRSYDREGNPIQPSSTLWEWCLEAKTKGGTGGAWKEYSTTFGPAGSGCEFIMPESAVALQWNVSYFGLPGHVYLDDVLMEEIRDKPQKKTK